MGDQRKVSREELEKAVGQDQPDFQNCDLSGLDLGGADLKGVNLSRANLEGAKVALLTLGASILTGTTMPDGTVHD